MNDAERFEQIFLSQVVRPGADKLLEWLKSTDFFTAPASTRFHGAYPGGLVKHSLNVLCPAGEFQSARSVFAADTGHRGAAA